MLNGIARVLTPAGVLVAEALFPARCAACRILVGHPGTFCDACAAENEPASGARFCTLCGNDLSSLDEILCPRCRERRPAFDELKAAYVYGGPVREAILALKHSGRLELGCRLGRLAATMLPRPDGAADPSPPGTVPSSSSAQLPQPGPCVVVPVPLHPRRLAERGYNQAALLARGMASGWGMALRLDILFRSRDTGSHQGRSATERRHHLAGAFSVRLDRLPFSPVVVLVDDVAASRATAEECSRTLKAAGASQVLVRVLAASSG